MIRTTSVTQLRDRLAETIDTLGDEQAVMVVRHSRPAAYLVSPQYFERLIDQLAASGVRLDLPPLSDAQTEGKAA